ncbi:MAG TPA: cytochrome b5 domain-containing protein [Syntrophales bacterium]|nr:cytochrome b5 domain-containing protein [Syntrophales bacterium]
MEQWDETSLAQFDGRSGKPIYIAFRGCVYDVTASKLWRDGLHMKRHQAGRDLTDSFTAAPHGEDVFSRYPQVGLYRSTDELVLPAWLAGVLDRYPILRRHPHPIAVHFPLVFLLSVFIFDLLHIVTGRPSFYDTSLFCLYSGLLMLPPAMITGFYTWWINYQAQAMNAVARKIQLSSLLLVLSTVILYWRNLGTDLLRPLRLESLFYLTLVLALWPLVITIGFLGGSLVFPHGKTKKAGID